MLSQYHQFYHPGLDIAGRKVLVIIIINCIISIMCYHFITIKIIIFTMAVIFQWLLTWWCSRGTPLFIFLLFYFLLFFINLYNHSHLLFLPKTFAHSFVHLSMCQYSLNFETYISYCTPNIHGFQHTKWTYIIEHSFVVMSPGHTSEFAFL